MKAPDFADVIIVGLGPTGAVLANILGQQGWSVCVLEREQNVYSAPRAVHFDDEIMRIFQSIGLSKEIGDAAQPFETIEFVNTADSEPLLSLDVGVTDQIYGYPVAWWFHQPTLETQLRAGLDRFASVTVHTGMNVQSVTQNANGVSVLAANSLDAQSKFQGRFLVGCDGGNSFVRKTMGLEVETANFDEPWVCVDTKSRSGGKDPKLPPNHRQICNPQQPVTYVPAVGGHYRWEFKAEEGKSIAEVTDPDLVRAQLSKFVDVDTIEIERIAHYQFHAVWATSWRKDRVFIAGDAAHQMPPFLGQGMCSGLRDAQNLAWRLDLVLSGDAPDAVLNNYGPERLGHVRELIKGAIILGRIIQTRKQWVAALRNALLFFPIKHSAFLKRLAYVQTNRKGPLTKGFIGKNRRKLAGHLFPQPRLAGETGAPLLDEFLGPRFTLLSLPGALSEHAEKIAKLTETKIVDHVEIMSPELSDWLEQNCATFVILRPDRHIFDAGIEQDLQPIIDGFLGHLNNGPVTV